MCVCLFVCLLDYFLPFSFSGLRSGFPPCGSFLISGVGGGLMDLGEEGKLQLNLLQLFGGGGYL